MERLTEFKISFVSKMPDVLEYGILYISLEYKVAMHKCPCGCGKEVITPFDSYKGWSIINNNGLITLEPSILNMIFECKSHYYIKNNKVVWL